MPKSPAQAPLCTTYAPDETAVPVAFNIPSNVTCGPTANVGVKAKVFPAINPETGTTPKHNDEFSVIVPVTLYAGKPWTYAAGAEASSVRVAESEPNTPEGIDNQAPVQFPVKLIGTGVVTVNVADEEFPPPGGGLLTT